MKNLRLLTIAALSLLAALSLSLLPATAQTLPDDQPVPVDPAFTEDLKGYLVTVTVRDKSGLAQANVSVTLGDKTVQTDPTGIASFQDVKAGDHQLSVDGQTKTITVITTTNKAAIQDFPITIGADTETSGLDLNSPTSRALLILLLVAVVVGILGRKRLMRRKKP